MSAAIECRKISKTYTRGRQTVTVLKDLDLEIESGEFVALMGPSGSGKTTLLNLIAGLDSPVAGELRVGGERIDRLSGPALARWRARHIGFVFQFYNLLPALTAEQNVEVPLLLANLPKQRRRRHVGAALQLVGLADRAQHKPSELSGGQQQRVSIARAIVPDPLILVCDEPTGDLDRDSAEEVLELLRMLNERHGKTIVMVTHDPKAAEYASRQLHVDKGLLISPALSAVEYQDAADAVQLAGPVYGNLMPANAVEAYPVRIASHAVARAVTARPAGEQAVTILGDCGARAPEHPKSDEESPITPAPSAATNVADVVQPSSEQAAAEQPEPQPATRIERGHNGRGTLIAGAAALVVLVGAGAWYLTAHIGTRATMRNAPVETNTAPAEVRQSASDPYLELAQRAFESAAYVTPKGVSAFDLYRKVLAADPTNAAAHEGIRSVADALLVSAERALLDQHFDAAIQALEQARTVDADHPHLEFVARQVEKERERFERTQESTVTIVAKASQVTPPPSANTPPRVEATAKASPAAPSPAATDATPNVTLTPAPVPQAVPSQTFASNPSVTAEPAAPPQPKPSTAAPTPDTLATTASSAPANVDATAVRAEPAVVAATTLEPIERVEPVFPATARARGLSGWVVVGFTVAADGRTTDISVQRASPSNVFDSAVIDAVNRWRYKPPLRDGQPAARRTAVKFSFVTEQ